MKYSDYFCDYSSVETKIKNGTDLTKLYALNEYQKSFTIRATFEVKLIDTFNFNINYGIPCNASLIMNFDLNSFNEEINKALLGKSADYITTHLIVMQIIMEKFNSCLIGICLNKDVENRMMKQIEMKNRILLYENRIR